ncbi:unnamed protein product [Rotaria sordida]|uniref:Protein kinase domain-containing protein n=2 Tax=Rotaria sordida TaxID=392033 RepID=A0A818T8I9_9BILA|nr:unnamed protein product [Rotaria sordida]
MITQLKHENQLYVHLKSLQVENQKSSTNTHDEKQMALYTLRQLHLNNVLHNDLRCENFLVNYDNNNDKHNRIMLCDFENAVILNEKDMTKKELIAKRRKQIKKIIKLYKMKI